MYDYNIGGQERKNEVNEGIADIPQNKTLLIERLTDEPPLSPQVIPDLKNPADVFQFFRPSKEVEFETDEGSARREKLEFRSLGDFGRQGITRQSNFLNELNQQSEDLQKFIRQLRSNKTLKTLLENKEAKASYIACLQGMIDELEQAG
jgi:hypothetical protein